MPRKNPRLNVVLEYEVYETLTNIAKKGISLSLLARDLIKESLEVYEDIYWDEVAKKRDGTFFYEKALSHNYCLDKITQHSRNLFYSGVKFLKYTF